jgi:hypothetical protein
MTRAAGVLALLAGLGFGIPGAFGVRHFARTGEVWTFLGFPTYGNGPFTSVGLDTSTPLLVGFTVLCAAETAIGVLLLGGWRPGLWIQFALLPVELAFWWGFSLPYGFVFGVTRAVVAAIALSN